MNFRVFNENVKKVLIGKRVPVRGARGVPYSLPRDMNVMYLLNNEILFRLNKLIIFQHLL